jgi:hypothetical protein
VGSSVVAVTHAGYVISGYAIVLLGLGGYLAHLLARSRRARAKAAAIVAKRAGSS